MMVAAQANRESVVARLRAALPRGRTLPAHLWRRRHRFLLAVLWAHVIVIPVVGWAYGGYSAGHSALHALPVIGLGALAALPVSRRVSSCVVAAGLLTCSALLVHVTGGLIESHFHFFVVMALLTLYEDWAPYALAFAYVGLHHGVIGTLAPGHVYSHGGPAWAWAVVHAFFIGAAGATNVMSWRMNEAARAHAAEEGRGRQRAEAAAQALRASLLPEPLPEIEHARLAARYRTGEGDVGGDWFEVIDLPDGRIGVGLGDVAGRGVGAAVLTGKLRHTLRAHASEGMAPAEVLARLDRVADGSFATVVYAVVDPEAETVRVSSGGHPPPLVVAPDGSADFVQREQGPVVTGFGDPFPETELPFPAGSTLVLYSDGLFERRGENADTSLARVRSLAQGVSEEPEALCSRLFFGLRDDWSDDTAVVALQTVAAAAETVVTVPADPEHVTALRHAAARWARAVGVADGLDGLTLAVGEAAANAIEHSGTRTVEMHHSVDGPQAKVVIRDFGRWLDRPPAEEDGDLLPRGRGLLLMRGFCDVSIEHRPDGTDVTLSVVRDAAPAPTDAATPTLAA